MIDKKGYQRYFLIMILKWILMGLAIKFMPLFHN